MSEVEFVYTVVVLATVAWHLGHIVYAIGHSRGCRSTRGMMLDEFREICAAMHGNKDAPQEGTCEALRAEECLTAVGPIVGDGSAGDQGLPSLVRGFGYTPVGLSLLMGEPPDDADQQVKAEWWGE